MSDVLYEVKEGGVAWITLNRPDSLNAMGGHLMPLLARHLADCAVDDDVRQVYDDDDPVDRMHVVSLTAVPELQQPQEKERQHLHTQDSYECAAELGLGLIV